MVNQSILIITFSLYSFGLFAQEKVNILQTFPIQISILNESISIPTINPFKYGFNPSIIVGTEYFLIKKGSHDFHLAGNIGYYYHKNWESTLFLDIGIGYRYNIKRWSIFPRLGIGYAHIFSPTPIYKFKGGQFTEVAEFGSPAAQGSFALNSGFRILKKQDSPTIFASYMFTAQIPNSIFGGLHQFVGLGCQFMLKKSKQQ